jgi:leucyl aminopeptidase
LSDGINLKAEETAQALTEGSMLGLYRFLKYKTNEEHDHKKEIKTLTILTENASSARAMQKGVKIGEVVAESTVMVRDMVSSPSADMTPTIIAAKARDIAKEFGLKLQVLERQQMEKLGMGALLGVASGSAQPPKFIIVEYRSGGKKPFIALVGKTITFDSGGISIKPAENMDKMKDDMSGGAAVLGAIRSAAALKLPLNIVGLLPATENMPSGRAYKPGDVLRTLSGQTIEIISTDAEGRLILADALAYASQYKPAVIVDIATLTGACRVALGQEAIGMLGTDDKVKQKMREAGEKTGERVWEMPLWEGYYDLIKSDIADMKNTGGRDGGVITAAALLSKFVQNYPWVHLDIAAMAWTEKDRPYTPKGATGIGVRLLTQFLCDYAASTK